MRSLTTRASIFALLLVVSGSIAGCRVDRSPSASKVVVSGREGWQLLTRDPLSPRTHPTVAIVGHRVVVMGGQQFEDCPAGEFCGRVPEARGGAVFDLHTHTWQPMGSIPKDADIGQVALVGRRLAVLAAMPHAPLELYDPAADRWTAAPDLDQTTAGTIAGIGGRVYVVPAYGSPPATLPFYDLRHGRWGHTPPIGLTSHQYDSPELLGDKTRILYVGDVRTGGHSAPWRTQVNQLTHGHWKPLPESPAQAGGFEWTGRQLLSGAVVASQDEPGVSLDPTTGTWSRLPPPPDGAGSPSGITIVSGVSSQPGPPGGGPAVVAGQFFDDRTGQWRPVRRPLGLVGGQVGAAWLGDRLLVVDDAGQVWLSPPER